MKKISICLITLMLAGCSVSAGSLTVSEEAESFAVSESIASGGKSDDVPEYKDYSAGYVIDDTSLVINAEADHVFDFSDPEILKQHSDSIFLGTIISKDGATAIGDDGSFLGIPYTLGTIAVQEVYLGEAEPVVSFRRAGAVMPLDAYLEGSPQERKDKIRSLLKDPDQPVIVSAFFLDDINPQVGKTYLFHALKTGDLCTLIGERYGCREVMMSDDTYWLADPAEEERNITLEAYLDAYVR